MTFNIYIYIYASLLWLHATIAKHSTTTPWHDLDTVQHDFQYILKKEKKEEENITYKFWNRLKVEDHPKLKGVFERVLVGFLKILSFLYKKKNREDKLEEKRPTKKREGGYSN